MKTLVLTWSLWALAAASAWATHIAGSDMEFKCLGNDNFSVTFRIYRDCRGVNLTNSISVSAVTQGCSPQRSANFTLPLDTFMPLRFLCPQMKGLCEGGNANIQFGIEEYVYTGIISLNQLFPGGLDPNCCIVKLSWSNCCRNNAILNIVNPGGQGFLTTGNINRCLTPCNSSPQFTNKPITVACPGQPICFNNGIIDTVDMDSLSYSMANPLNTDGSPISFQAPFSATSPLQFLGFPNASLPYPAGFHLDPVTGTCCFTPTLSGAFVLAIKVEEWRKINGVYVKIGETRRDAQFYIATNMECTPNNPPEIEVNGSRNGPWTYEVCAGSPLCLNFKATDKDKGPLPAKLDTTLLSWNAGIPGATFVHSNSPMKVQSWDEGTFCWTPENGHVSSLPYFFTIKAEDDNCPVPGMSMKAVSVYVRPSPLAARNYREIACSRYQMEMALLNSQSLDTPRVTYEWAVSNVGNGVFSFLGSSIYSGRTAQHTFATGGYFVVRARVVAPPCSSYYFDTIYVQPPLQAMAMPDTFVCFGNSIGLQATAAGGHTPYHSWWLAATDTLRNLQVSPRVKTAYYFELTDSMHCKSRDTVEVDVRALPGADLGPDRRICAGDSIFLDAGDNEGKGLLHYAWTGPGIDAGTSRQVFVRDSGVYMVEVTDSFTCKAGDTLQLHVNRPVLPDAGPDTGVCVYSSITLHAARPGNFSWTAATDNVLLSDKDTLLVHPLLAQDLKYVLKASETTSGVTCFGYDTVQVKVYPLPQIAIPNPDLKYCLTKNWINLTQSTGINYPDKFVTWSFVDLSKNKCINQDPNSPYHKMVMDSCVGTAGPVDVNAVVKDEHGCESSKQIKLTIYPLPQVYAGPDTSICGNAPAVNIFPYPNFGVGSHWELFAQDSAGCNSCLVNMMRNHTFYPNRTKQNQTYHLVYVATDMNNCVNRDTAVYFVKPVPVAEAGLLSPLCEDAKPIDLLKQSGATPAGGVWSGKGVDALDGTFNPSKAEYFGNIKPNLLHYTCTNSYKCTATDSVSIVVHRLPPTKLVITDTAICDDHAPVHMVGYPAGNGGLFFINWQKQSSNLLNPADSILLNASPEINRVHYTYTDPQTGCSKTDSATVRVQRKPVVGIIASKALCIGQPYNLSAFISNGNSFEWSTAGDGFFTGGNPPVSGSTSTEADVIYAPGTTDNSNYIFTVKLTSTANGLCPAAEETRNIPINKNPSGNFTAPSEGCEPFMTGFDGEFFDYAQLNWDFGDGTFSQDEDPEHLYKHAGSYNVRVFLQSQDGCRDTVSKLAYINVNPTPHAYFEPDKKRSTVALPRFVFFSDKSEFNTSFGGSVSWHWDFGDPKKDDDTLTLNGKTKPVTYTYDADTGTYTVRLLAVSDRGCPSEWEDVVVVEPDITVFAPNAFKPSSGLHGTSQCPTCRNDRFAPVVNGQQTYHLEIFNRWGELVFACDNPDEGWDGRYRQLDCEQDVYAWQLAVTGFDNTLYRYSGTVTLLR